MGTDNSWSAECKASGRAYRLAERAWNLHTARGKRIVQSRFGVAGGYDGYQLHNWICCSRTDPRAGDARALRADADVKITQRQQRIKRAEASMRHAMHASRGEAGRYLWCDGCRAI